MLTVLKALAIVLGLSLAVFILGKPLLSRIVAEKDYAVRRNAWIAITAAAFLVSNFWLYSLVSAIIVVYSARRDSNPAALYLFLLLAAPPLADLLPTFGLLTTSIYYDHLRGLSFVLLLPLLSTVWQRNADGTASRLTGVDKLVLAYVVLQFVLLFPSRQATANIRAVLLLGTDILLPYFVISRAVRSKAMLADCMASYVLAMMVLSPIAVFEMLKGWALYAMVAERWDLVGTIHYLTRGSFLRGQVTSGHSLVLGYCLAVGMCMWLYVQTHVPKTWGRSLGTLNLVGGLVGSLARGSWVGSLIGSVTYFAVGPRGASRLLKAGIVGGIVAAVAILSPWGGEIIDHLPFVGSVDADNVTYRQRLAEVSWNVIMQNPLFGTPNYLEQMEEMRQGEGIIDIVNVYAAVALAYGFAGLSCFVGALGLGLFNCFRAVRHFAATDPDYAMMGASLIACLTSGIVMMGTVSPYLSIPYLNWSLLGLAWAYVRLAESHAVHDIQPISARVSPAGRSL